MGMGMGPSGLWFPPDQGLSVVVPHHILPMSPLAASVPAGRGAAPRPPAPPAPCARGGCSTHRAPACAAATAPSPMAPAPASPTAVSAPLAPCSWCGTHRPRGELGVREAGHGGLWGWGRWGLGSWMWGSGGVGGLARWTWGSRGLGKMSVRGLGGHRGCGLVGLMRGTEGGGPSPSARGS